MACYLHLEGPLHGRLPTGRGPACTCTYGCTSVGHHVETIWSIPIRMFTSLQRQGVSHLTFDSFNTVCWSSGESLFSCSRPLYSCNTSVSSSQLAPVTSHFGQYRFSCIPTLYTMSPSHSCRSSLVPRGRRSGTRPSLKATASTYLR